MTTKLSVDLLRTCDVLGLCAEGSVHVFAATTRRTQESTVANMPHCRFRNTLADVRDCFGALEDMTTDEPVAPLRREELAAAEGLVTICLDILRLLCEISGDDLDDDLDPAKLVRRLNADVVLRR
ncbi:MAG: hypothetical protein ACREP7_22980 [Lysobacter sp.]